MINLIDLKSLVAIMQVSINETLESGLPDKVNSSFIQHLDWNQSMTPLRTSEKLS